MYRGHRYTGRKRGIYRLVQCCQYGGAGDWTSSRRNHGVLVELEMDFLVAGDHLWSESLGHVCVSSSETLHFS